MPRLTYYTATTLDGFLADTSDSLAWLLRQDVDEAGPFNYAEFIADIGAIVMGSTTYEWVLREYPDEWFYDVPVWVMTSRTLPAREGADIRFASGSVREVYDAMATAAGGRDLWVVGGGDLAGQFADAGLLDEVVVNIAPVVLGAGRQLLPRQLDLRLVDTARNRAFVGARYEVVGPLAESARVRA